MEGIPSIKGIKFILYSAGKALGLGIGQADQLFLVYNWPPKFQTMYVRACAISRKRTAEVAIEYIDYFIQTERNRVVRPLN